MLFLESGLFSLGGHCLERTPCSVFSPLEGKLFRDGGSGGARARRVLPGDDTPAHSGSSHNLTLLQKKNKTWKSRLILARARPNRRICPQERRQTRISRRSKEPQWAAAQLVNKLSDNRVGKNIRSWTLTVLLEFTTLFLQP